MKKGASTKWLKGLLNKSCLSAEYEKGGKFFYYGHEIDVIVGVYHIVNINIDHHMEISVDEDLGKVTCRNIPKNYIKPIMDYLNQLYWGFVPYFTNKFTKLILDYASTSEQRNWEGYVTIDWFNEEDKKEKMDNYEEKFIERR